MLQLPDDIADWNSLRPSAIAPDTDASNVRVGIVVTWCLVDTNDSLSSHSIPPMKIGPEAEPPEQGTTSFRHVGVGFPPALLGSWDLQRCPNWNKLGLKSVQAAMAVRLIANRGPRLLPWGLEHELILAQQITPPIPKQFEPVCRRLL